MANGRARQADERREASGEAQGNSGTEGEGEQAAQGRAKGERAAEDSSSSAIRVRSRTLRTLVGD